MGRVLPFGSLVTGLATPTSDVDAVLLTEWTKEDEQHFGYEFYLAGNIDFNEQLLKNQTGPWRR